MNENPWMTPDAAAVLERMVRLEAEHKAHRIQGEAERKAFIERCMADFHAQRAAAVSAGVS